jgi:undecaprenyl diphosphate synthase
MSAIIGKQNRDISLEEICKRYSLNPETLPKHVAIIMDGNGRWAKQRNKQRIMGHKAGVEALKRAIKACADLGVHHLSVYAFSTENWKRPKAEVTFLMQLLKNLLDRDVQELHKEGARIRVIGDVQGLDKTLQKKIKSAEELTQHNSTIEFNIMINYGSRMEITNAISKIVEKAIAGEITEITEETLSSHLLTAGTPDPDILVRTSGEERISNYLLWQISYTELFFIDTLWPDFEEQHLGNIIADYQNRDRRYGGLNT